MGLVALCLELFLELLELFGVFCLGLGDGCLGLGAACFELEADLLGVGANDVVDDVEAEVVFGALELSVAAVLLFHLEFFDVEDDKDADEDDDDWL